MPNIFDQFDEPTATVTPDGQNPFDQFDGNVFDQFFKPVPLKITSLPGNLKLNPLQQVLMQREGRMDPELEGATAGNYIYGNDDAFLSSVAPPITAAAHAIADNPITRGVGFGMNFLGQALKGDAEAALFSMVGQKELANQQLIATAGNMNPAWKQKDESLGIDTSDPYEEARNTLPMAERMASGIGPGLIQSAPQFALSSWLPVAGAASFGFTPQGFDPVQAAAAMIAPVGGKMIGGIAERLAAKAGISNDQALGVINQLGGGVGVAGLISTPAVYQIAQMDPGKERDEAIQDAASNAILTGILGSFAGRGHLSGKPESQPTADEGLTTSEGENLNSQKLDDLEARLRDLEATLRRNQFEASTESLKPPPIDTSASETQPDESSQDTPNSPASTASTIPQPRFEVARNAFESAASEPHFNYSEDEAGGLDDQTTQAGVKRYLRQRNYVPPIQVVNDPTWTHNGYGVRGTVQDGNIIVNRAFIDSADTLKTVLREEHSHWLLSTDEGRQAIRAAMGSNLGLSQLADLSVKYPIQPGESVLDYRARLTDEFIARAASEELPIWKQIVERGKGWLADKGIGELNDEETVRSIVRSLKANKSAETASLATPFDVRDTTGEEPSEEENSNLAARYNLTSEPLEGMSSRSVTEKIDALLGTRKLPIGIRVFRNSKVPWKTKVLKDTIVLNSAHISSPKEAMSAILHEGIGEIWYQQEAQKAMQGLRQNLTLKELQEESDRRRALGLPTDWAIVREEAAISKVANSNGNNRVVNDFQNRIRGALNARFGLNLPATAHPQLKEAMTQFLRYRDGLQGVPVSDRALIPRAAVSLGKWGEMRLGQVLNGSGTKPSKSLKTSLGRREIDRLLHGIAHESKAGLNVKLEGKIRTQILKDAELLRKGKVDGVHWHFFRGAQPDVLSFLEENGIGYTVY